MEKSFRLRLKQPETLINFLVKFKSFDNNLLLEFKSSNEIKAKAFNVSKSVIKIGTIDFKETFDQLDDQVIPENIRIRIFNIERLIKVLKSISKDEIDLVLGCNLEENLKEDIYYVDQFVIITKNLKMTIPQGTETLIKYLSDDIINSKIGIDNFYFQLEFTKEFLDKLDLLADLDQDEKVKIESFINDTKKVLKFSGKNFNLKSNDEFEIKENSQILIDKRSLKYIDKENYCLYGKSSVNKDNKKLNCLLFDSKESNFKILMASTVTE